MLTHCSYCVCINTWSSSGEKGRTLCWLTDNSWQCTQKFCVAVCGRSQCQSGKWQERRNCTNLGGVRGCQGFGKLNESGEVLLSFCALNELNCHHEHLLWRTTFTSTRGSIQEISNGTVSIMWSCRRTRRGCMWNYCDTVCRLLDQL